MYLPRHKLILSHRHQKHKFLVFKFGLAIKNKSLLNANEIIVGSSNGQSCEHYIIVHYGSNVVVTRKIPSV